MAIRFSFEDNFIGCIYSNRRLIWNKIVNKQRPPPPKKSRDPVQPTPNLISKTPLFIGFYRFHVVSMRLLVLTFGNASRLFFILLSARARGPVEVDRRKRIDQDE